jgi:diguanylate cyclase (GGDEF)-like protein
MKLRAKLFIPLLLFSLLFGLYCRLYWLPHITESMLQQSTQNWHAHLTSAAEGLIPLLLENQLANVYENLDALLEQNRNWLSIKLTDNSGKQLYPLSSTLKITGHLENIQTHSLPVGFTEPALAKLEVIRDLNPLLSEVNSLEEHLNYVLILLLLAFVLLNGSMLDWQVRRRLTQLSQAAKRLSAGDYQAALPNQSKDEIGELTNSFHSMRQELAVYHQQLQGEIDGHKRTAEALKDEKERFSYQATHDQLTGLINRPEFERRLKETLNQACIDNSSHALLYLDLDQFKIVNDTCGHIAGDALLQQLRASLQEHIRLNDTLARLGGDEFGVLLKHCSLDDALKVANNIREAIKNFCFLWDGKIFSIGVSIGAVDVNKHSGNISSLLSSADSACYMAKDLGRNRVQVYEKTDADLSKQHGDMLWASRITDALSNNNFELYCQPIVPLSSSESEPSHYEVLVRMRDEHGNLSQPGAFIPAAERFDMITQLDRWVIDHAFNYLQQRDIPGELCLSINISGKSLNNQPLLKHIENRIRDGDIGSHKIFFEITESAAVASLVAARNFIETLKLVGCGFMLDDFGKGMSSFSYLKTLPVDYLKIDGAFVKDIVSDQVDRAMVDYTNNIAHTMQLKTVAEFVENHSILEELHKLGVDYVQGYHICKPFPLKELTHNGEWNALYPQGVELAPSEI